MHLLKHRTTMFYLGFVLILGMAIGGVAFGAFAAGPTGSGPNGTCTSTDPAGSLCGTPSTTTASATIIPGTLSETADSSATANAVTLNGTNQSTSYSFNINVVDARGTGAGWNLTMQTSQFQTAGNTHQLSSTASTLSTVTAICVTNTSCSASGGAAQTPGSDLSTAAKIWSAGSTGQGMGSWTVTPTVGVAIPANTYAGTYTSNVTVDLVAGP
ncbi:MAG: WxL domain-containing protein [Ktedonobacteraceae bacterium]